MKKLVEVERQIIHRGVDKFVDNHIESHCQYGKFEGELHKKLLTIPAISDNIVLWIKCG